MWPLDILPPPCFRNRYHRRHPRCRGYGRKSQSTSSSSSAAATRLDRHTACPPSSRTEDKNHRQNHDHYYLSSGDDDKNDADDDDDALFDGIVEPNEEAYIDLFIGGGGGIETIDIGVNIQPQDVSISNTQHQVYSTKLERYVVVCQHNLLYKGQVVWRIELDPAKRYTSSCVLSSDGYLEVIVDTNGSDNDNNEVGNGDKQDKRQPMISMNNVDTYVAHGLSLSDNVTSIGSSVVVGSIENGLGGNMGSDVITNANEYVDNKQQNRRRRQSKHSNPSPNPSRHVRRFDCERLVRASAAAYQMYAVKEEVCFQHLLLNQTRTTNQDCSSQHGHNNNWMNSRRPIHGKTPKSTNNDSLRGYSKNVSSESAPAGRSSSAHEEAGQFAMNVCVLDTAQKSPPIKPKTGIQLFVLEGSDDARDEVSNDARILEGRHDGGRDKDSVSFIKRKENGKTDKYWIDVSAEDCESERLFVGETSTVNGSSVLSDDYSEGYTTVTTPSRKTSHHRVQHRNRKIYCQNAHQNADAERQSKTPPNLSNFGQKAVGDCFAFTLDFLGIQQ
jgi:hypothetical protein